MKKRQRMAFGVEPADYAYRLRLARYVGLAESVHRYAAERGAAGPLRLVEIGSGKGRTLRYLEAQGDLSRLRFHGLDISAGRLGNIYRKDLWNLVEGDADRPLPFRSGRFDIVVCEQVLEHLENPWGAFAELVRILRPGGLLIVGVPVFPPPFPGLRQRVALPVLTRWRRRVAHIQSFSCAGFVRRIRARRDLEVRDVRGFRVVSGGFLRFLENHRWWWEFNRTLGRTVPPLCQEVQVVAVKREAPCPAAPCE